MESTQLPILVVSDFIALTNQTLEYAYSSVAIEGEVSGFKVNQGKYVFFDLKDSEGSIGCFMTVWQLRQPIEDGMKVVVVATPKLTKWGKFSLTVQTIRPSGEGNIKRSFELLKAKLEHEGLFSPERKRALPTQPKHIAVISSTGAAGYSDFIKILDDRWGGLRVDVAHVQVQGKDAPDQIIRALRYFTTQEVLPEVIAIVRGGGSADDLSAFNDELLVREIAASRVPTIVGVGHEVDISLADLAADVRAATPSNAAQLIVPDKHERIQQLEQRLRAASLRLSQEVELEKTRLRGQIESALRTVRQRHESAHDALESRRNVLAELDPNKVLQRGYAIIRGNLAVGQSIEVETGTIVAIMEVTHVRDKKA